MALSSGVWIIIVLVILIILLCLCLYSCYRHVRKSRPGFHDVPGPFKQIGTSVHYIPDRGRFKMFYPTSMTNIKASHSEHPSTYFVSKQAMNALCDIEGFPKWLVNLFDDMGNSRNPMPCYNGAAVYMPTNEDYKHPLVIFSHGRGASFDMLTQTCCGLASYGLIVALIEHTDGSALFTKLTDGTEICYDVVMNYEMDGVKNTTYEKDVTIYGPRLKKRVTDFKALYRYLESGEFKEDEPLASVMAAADTGNVVFMGHSFGCPARYNC